MAGVDGAALGAIAAGSLFLYAGLTGKSVLLSVRSIIGGKTPTGTPVINPIGAVSAGTVTGNGTVTGAETNVSGGSAQKLLQIAAAQRGWDTGAQWQALQNVEMAEAGFNPNATNPKSGAYGLAQALGHGTSTTAGSVTNQYGGFGLNDAQARAANSGDAGEQAVWMCNYIAARYGNPVNAWAHEQSAGWY